MARLPARRTLLVAALLVACDSQPSHLDVPNDGGAAGLAGDPWSTSAAQHADRDEGRRKNKEEGGGLGGLDLKNVLSKIAESIEKPGPYEAPERSKDFDETKPHWGVLELDGEVVERAAFSVTGGHGTELRKVIDRLRDLAKDSTLTGVLVRLAPLEISLPDVIELRAAMHDLRTAGKKVACHTEDATNAPYLILAACERIGLAPLGQIAIPGPAAMPIHIKALLDKLSITADFLHVGAYKGAAEPLTRDAPSKEMEETLGAILDHRYETMVEVISRDRKLDTAAVKTLIDDALFPSVEAKAAHLVDDVIAFEAFRDQVTVSGPWTELPLEPSGGKDQLQAMLKIARFIGAMPPERPVGDHIAVVYALGNIVDGDGDGVLGARQQIASHTLVAALRAITADDTIKAVVIRIDSGGGSAQASELIWEAVHQLKAKKPVIVSMSDVAASGGYYIASDATKIFALADTLTGSIGVVGGKIAPGAALAKVGVTTFPMGRGKRATMMTSFMPWRADEKAVIQSSMEAVYKVFVGRVAEGRHKTLEDILPIAQGRVWTGTRAKELGLVDAIGGLDAALAEARALTKIDAAVGLEVYPPSPTLRDVLMSFGGVQAPLGLRSGAGEAIAALRAVDPEVATAAERLVELALSFRTTTIQAVTVLPVVR